MPPGEREDLDNEGLAHNAFAYLFTYLSMFLFTFYLCICFLFMYVLFYKSFIPNVLYIKCVFCVFLYLYTALII